MKQVNESKMRDVKAAIAVGAADVLPEKERVPSVAALLQCDEDEARALISRGRRIAREKRVMGRKGRAA